MKQTFLEALLILLLSLCLALLYNAISPGGIRILPRKETISTDRQLRPSSTATLQAVLAVDLFNA